MTDHHSHEKQIDCCSTQASHAAEPIASADRIGRLSTPAAVGSAIFSSACCWLPLLPLAFGLSAGVIARFFETVRPFFLAAAVLFLGAGFYFVYFRKPACKPRDACAVLNPKLQRFNRSMLWVAAAFVVAFALFPYYSPTLLRAFAAPPGATAGADTSEARAGAVEQVTRTYAIDGMTCIACAATLEAQLKRLAGVTEALVSYQDATAPLRSSPQEPTDQAVRAAVERSGFRLADPSPDS